MNKQSAGSTVGLALIPILMLTLAVTVRAENIDPASNASQYAWAENLGWLNAEPSGDNGPGVQVGDDEISGWIWGENVGWISLSCKNTLTCATAEYGVVNDGTGVLSGYAWAENIGWINFAPSTSGVTIDPATGEFSGYAWGENVGWLSFNCSDTASCGAVNYKVTTGWVCDPLPAAPAGAPSLVVDDYGTDAKLEWSIGGVTGATGADIVYGDLATLRSSGGDFGAATLSCLDDNRTSPAMFFGAVVDPGAGVWFLVRGQNCGGSGTYDSAGGSQVGSRDGEIGLSGNDCP